MFAKKKKLELLKQKIRTHIEICDKKGQYSLFNSSYAQKIFKDKLNAEKMEYLTNYLMEWDNNIAVPKEVGEDLESLINDENYCTGIHRTEIDGNAYNSEIVSSIFNEGLRNLGDLSSGVVDKRPPVSKTVSFVSNMPQALIQLESHYKNSKGGFIITIPKELLDEDGYVSDQNFNKVYDVKDDIPYIKPDFIMGYIDTRYGVMNYMSKEEVLKAQVNQNL